MKGVNARRKAKEIAAGSLRSVESTAAERGGRIKIFRSRPIVRRRDDSISTFHIAHVYTLTLIFE